MNQDPDIPPFESGDEDIVPLGENTVDLTIDGVDEVDDLQALADQIAEETPDPAAWNRPTRPSVPGSDEDGPLTDLNRELEATTTKLIEAEKREAEQMDKHHRLLADFANYRNRTTRDIQMAVDLAEKKLLLEMLPVVDNFERCISATYASAEDCRNGVALIHKQFQDSLKRLGVERLETQVGDPFDAQFADALTTTSDPNLPDGCIATVFEPGYRLRDQLLRPARVVVNHAPEPESHGTIQ